jgi:hypothetical protein
VHLLETFIRNLIEDARYRKPQPQSKFKKILVQQSFDFSATIVGLSGFNILTVLGLDQSKVFPAFNFAAIDFSMYFMGCLYHEL